MRRSLAAALLALAAPAFGQAVDPMSPQGNVADALVSPLSAITVVTEDLLAARRLYQGAFAMVPQTVSIGGAEAQALIRHWGLAPAEMVEAIIFSRPGVPQAVAVRVIRAGPDQLSSRPGRDALLPGGLGFGIPAHGLSRLDQILTAYGFASSVGVTAMNFPRADGSEYTVGETHYLAPDDLYVLAVDRADMAPVGPIDPALDVGGPGYSSAIVADADVSAQFFRDVLGLQMRREFTYAAGSKGGLAMPDGSKVRFQQWFAPGASTGYLVIMDVLTGERTLGQPLGPKNRGLAMWSFETKSLREVEARARKADTRILSAPQRLNLPGIGAVQAMVIAGADGLPVEIYERRR